MLFAFSFHLLLLFVAAQPVTMPEAQPGALNIIYQSTDGGQTWQDVSEGLPVNELPEDFFAGESELYLRVKDEMYRSKSKLKTPVWERVNVPNPRGASIAFNRSGVMSFNYEGQIYQKVSSETWLPRFTNFKKTSVRSVFESSDGTVFVGSDDGIFKSTDSGQSWKQVHTEGGAMDMVEADGVIIARGQKGILRSTDKGDHWQWVLTEGGVGIAVERIEGGFAAISCNTGTISRRIHRSTDHGKTWSAIDEGLRPTLFITSIKQFGKYLVCGHPDGIFRSADLGKTWTKVHPGVDENDFKFKTVADFRFNGEPSKVFTIYVSGNVLYAVAGGAGC